MTASRLLCLFALWLPLAAWAAPTFDVSVDRTRIGTSQTVTVTARTTMEAGAASAQLIPPDLSDWDVVGRFQRSSRDGFSGRGTVSQQLVLQPLRTGELTIGAFELRVGQESVKSQPIKVQVGLGSARPAPPVPEPPSPEAVPGTPGDPAAPQPPAVEDYAFMRWEVDTPNPWLGQPIRARLMGYVERRFGAQVSDLKIDLDGFFKYEDPEPPGPEGVLTEVGGQLYRTRALATYTLFPLKSGPMVLPAASVSVEVFTEGAFSRRAIPLERTAPAVTLDVRPLPTEGRPADFKGPAVGRVSLSANTDRSKADAADGFQLTVVTEVTGVIHNVPELTLPELPGFRVFPPSTSVQERMERGTVVGVRRQTWLLRPTQAGQVTVPRLALPYFDPYTGRYATAATRPIPLTATGQAVAAPTAPTAPKPGQAERALALRSIRKTPDLSPARPSLLYAPWFWLALLLPPLGLLGLIARDHWRARQSATAGSRAARGAAERARRRLAKTPKDPAVAFAHIAKVLLDYLEARFATPFNGLTHPRLKAELRARGISEAVTDAWIVELENCDFARFAPAAAGGPEVGEAVTRATALIGRIEESAR